MKVYLLRIRNPQTRKNLWVAFNKKNSVRAKSRKKALENWEKEHGKITFLVRFKGIHQPSEAAMTVAEIQMEKE